MDDYQKTKFRISLLLAVAFSLMLILPFVFASVRSGPNDFSWYINDPPPTGPPNYPPTRTTGYWIALEEDWPAWYTGAKQPGATGCTIPVSERGFYEDVKCEGTGMTNEGKFTRYTTIKKTREESEPDFVDPASQLSTSRKRPPVRPRRTIARVIAEGNECNIPMWSRVYIKYPDPNNPNTGWYIAEDSGGGFHGQYDYCKIDVFLGIGKQAPLGTVSPTVPLNNRAAWPQVWVFPGERDEHMWEDNIITFIQGMPAGGRPPGQGGVPSSATASVSEEPLPGSAGYRPSHPYFSVPYSVNPSFSATIPYDFSIYDSLPESLHRLERCKDDIDCIVNNVSLIEAENPELDWIVKYGGNVLSVDDSGVEEYVAWESHCETSDQHAVNSLAEAIDTCARSSDNDCVCPYTLPIVTPAERDMWYVFIPYVGPVLGIAALLTEPENDDWEDRVIGFVKSGSGVRVFMREPGSPEPQVVPNTDFKSVESAIRGGSASELTYEPSDDGDVLHIYKDSRNNISIYPEDGAPSSEVCELHNKLVKFCVVQNNTFFAYNQEDNKMGLQQLVMKFAYLFSSDVTDVGGFEVRDARFASNKSLLVWDPVVGVDVNYYTVYYSENTGMEANLRNQAPGSLTPELQAELQSEQLYADSKQDISISLESLAQPDCEVDRTSCLPSYRLTSVLEEDTSGVLLDDRVLYYSVVDDKFFYFLPDMVNGQSYFFAITATDVNGDESPSFNIPETREASADDVPPGLANVRGVQLNPATNDVEIQIDTVDYSIDNGALDPGEVTRFKIYCFDAADLSEDFDLSTKEALFGEGMSSSGDGSISISRPATDFTGFACGLDPASPRQVKIVVAGVKTLSGSDIDYRGKILPSALSSQTVILPES